MTITIPSSITPSRLRILLIAALVLILLAGGGIFYIAFNKLSQSAVETCAQVAKSRESRDTLQRLQILQRDLGTQQDTIDMTSRIVADSQNFAYQDRLVNDLTIYANRAGLSLVSISFMNQASTPESGAALPGLKKATVDITLKSPTNYRSLLDFLHYVEQNLTKLKVSKVTMTKNSTNAVTIDVLNLEVYLR